MIGPTNDSTTIDAPGRNAAPSAGSSHECNLKANRRGAWLAVLAVVGLAAMLWWFDPAEARLPMCTFRAMTGLDCPGCGAARATHELLNGHLLAAWRLNALWVLLLPVVAYAALSEWRTLLGRRPLPGDLLRQPWFWVAVVAAGTAFFVLRNLPPAHLFHGLRFW